MTDSEIFSLQMSKIEAVTQTFQKPIDEWIKEEAKTVYGEVVEVLIVHSANGVNAKISELILQTNGISTDDDLGSKMIKSLTQEKV